MKIKYKKPEQKIVYRGLDFINSLEPKLREFVKKRIFFITQASPTLSYEDIVMLPFDEFYKFTEDLYKWYKMANGDKIS
ncbi:MAG: hypothetical protein ACFFG0_30830 [Candidatus Thorarchaeota archaeon]